MPDDATSPPPRKAGRPPAREPGSRVTAWIPASEHDRLIRDATRRNESISGFVRRILTTRPRK
jgi:hypothetical protein